MSIKTSYETKFDAMEDIEKNFSDIDGKSIEVGCLKGEHRWLAGIHEFG